MIRSGLVLRWLGLTALLASLAAIAWLAMSPIEADAQAGSDPVFSLAASDPGTDTLATVAVSFTPGVDSIAAIGVSLEYDPQVLTYESCSVAELGACNDDGGVVKFSLLNLAPIEGNDQLVTADFAPVEGATGSSTVTLTVTTVAGLQGAFDLQFVPESIDLVVTEPIVASGSLSGGSTDATTTGLYDLDVCATHLVTETPTCTSTTGLGTWRIDDLAVGDYLVVVSDPSEERDPVELSAAVVADQVTAGLDVTLPYASEVPQDDSPQADDAEQGTATTSLNGPASSVNSSKTVEYQASISGTVRDMQTLALVHGVQVCATQPDGLQQSCATTNPDGQYELTGATTGNYWVTVVDPLGRYQDSNPRLLGVVGDFTSRTGVVLGVSPN